MAGLGFNTVGFTPVSVGEKDKFIEEILIDFPISSIIKDEWEGKNVLFINDENRIEVLHYLKAVNDFKIFDIGLVDIISILNINENIIINNVNKLNVDYDFITKESILIDNINRLGLYDKLVTLVFSSDVLLISFNNVLEDLDKLFPKRFKIYIKREIDEGNKFIIKKVGKEEFIFWRYDERGKINLYNNTEKRVL